MQLSVFILADKTATSFLGLAGSIASQLFVGSGFDTASPCRHYNHQAPYSP